MLPAYMIQMIKPAACRRSGLPALGAGPEVLKLAADFELRERVIRKPARSGFLPLRLGRPLVVRGEVPLIVLDSRRGARRRFSGLDLARGLGPLVARQRGNHHVNPAPDQRGLKVGATVAGNVGQELLDHLKAALRVRHFPAPDRKSVAEG